MAKKESTNTQNSSKMPPEIEARIMEYYAKVTEMEEELFSLQEDIKSLLNDASLNDLCNLPETAQKVTELANRASNLVMEIPNLIMECSDLVETCAVQIILKKLEMIRLYTEKMVKVLQLEMIKIERDSTKRMVNGEGSTPTPATAAITAANASLAAAAQVINKVMGIIGVLLQTINMMFPTNVEGGGMAFFPTPKSIQKVVPIASNPGKSITNCLGQMIEEQVSKAATAVKAPLSEEKKAKIAAKAAAGSTAATAATGFSLPSFGKLQSISVESIMNVINTAILMLGMAEPLPKYEKLNIINLRFVMWLSTGFCPAGKTAFGIPGQP